MEYHPDKNPNGGDKFKEIFDAYRILNDPEQKAIYDNGKTRGTIRDLQKELAKEVSGRDLKDWVSDLMRSEREESDRRLEFERRRREEMRRRAEFDATHPNFASGTAPFSGRRAPMARADQPYARGLDHFGPSTNGPMGFAPKPPYADADPSEGFRTKRYVA
jgi:curved DNA-binding protein CbpA